MSSIPLAALAAPDFAPADTLINAAIARGDCPGAVLVVGNKSAILYEKAFGHRALQPAKEPMTLDTIFDIASLTKPIATATSIMILSDRGKIDLKAPAARYWPDFAANDKDKITVEQLLLHFGGLIPDNALSDYSDGPEKSWQRIAQLKPTVPAGSKFAYTDMGYIVLGRLVEKTSGQSLDRFAAEELFKPLAMNDSSFAPPAVWATRIAPTQKRGDHWMRGEVHDPRAYALGGVAGHAGLFSTASDLARYCRMILNTGQLDGKRLLSPRAIQLMSTGQSPATGQAVRTLGFDMKTGYSHPLGRRFTPLKSFGHTGFTGTCLWISPTDNLFFVFLTNAVHPDGKGKVLELRRDVSTAVAEAVLGKNPDK